MLSSIKKHPFIEENISISSGNKPNQKNQNKIPIIRKDNEKNDIIIDLSQKKETKKEEDEFSMNSAEFSGQVFKEEKIKYKAKTERQKPLFKTKKDYERYNERIKERTMRLEIEKMDKETERLQKEYEEKNSYNYLFNNNPQFKKMVKSVQIQLLLIFIISILILILSSIVYFNLTKKKLGISLANIVLSISEITIILVLIISINIGLLNDPDLSKTIRLFISFEFILQIVTFVFNIIIPFLIYHYLNKKSKVTMVITYLLFAFVILLTIFSFKFCYILYLESFLILLNKKTEYAILIIKEQNNKINQDLSVSNNISTLQLNQTESNLITDNEKIVKADKNDEKYRNFHFFNRFHYSITSDRKEPNYFK